MLGNIKGFFKKFGKKEEVDENTKDAAKERLHLVLMQDRANVSADFLEMMKQEIIDVIKKYVDVDEEEIDVRLTNQINDDGSNGAPALYANIPIKGINNETKGAKIKEAEKKSNKNIKSEIKENVIEKNGNDNKKEAKKVVQDEKKQEINKKVPENEENKKETIKKVTKKDSGKVKNDSKEKKITKKVANKTSIDTDPVKTTTKKSATATVNSGENVATKTTKVVKKTSETETTKKPVKKTVTKPASKK